MILSSRLTLSVAVLASVPLAAIAQPVDTPGVTSPLTPDQIARENPPSALSGAAADKPVVLKSRGGKLCPIDGPAMQSKLSSLELDQ